MRILISGSTGFIGTNLIQYLTANVKNVSLSYLVRKGGVRQNEFLWQDLAKIDLESFDAVVHLAGLAHDTKNATDDEAYYKVNFELTRILYDWFLKSKAKKFIYVSSVKAVADSVTDALTEEETPTPITVYGKSKFKAEQYIQQLSLGLENKRYYILRPCMVHGPGNKGNLNLLYKFVNKGLPYPLGAYENKRSFLSVENFCFINYKILTADVDSGIYNIADDKPLSTTQLYCLIAKVSGKKAKVLHLPQSLINMLAKLGDVFKLPINTERVGKLTGNYVVDNSKIKRALGINQLPIRAEDGLKLTIQSFN